MQSCRSFIKALQVVGPFLKAGHRAYLQRDPPLPNSKSQPPLVWDTLGAGVRGFLCTWCRDVATSMVGYIGELLMQGPLI